MNYKTILRIDYWVGVDRLYQLRSGECFYSVTMYDTTTAQINQIAQVKAFTDHFIIIRKVLE